MTDNKCMDGMGSRINVVLVVRDTNGTYARHAAVVMASVFANTSRRIRIHIIHDDTLSGENIEKLRLTADNFGQEIQFINAENILAGKNLAAGKLALGGHRGKLLKLLIPELIDVSKVIYLDCDIVVSLDLGELWDIDIGEKAVGAVNDVWYLDRCKEKHRSWRRGIMLKAMGIAEKTYFNSGVLVLDLDKIRMRYDLISEASIFYKKYRKITTLTDQDCFNYIFVRDTRIVDEKFNRIDFSDIDEQERSTFPCIWHMTGGKPWECYSRPGVDELYWHYMAMTPWGTDIADLIKAMVCGLQSNKYCHQHSSDCARRLKQQIADNIFRAHIWLMPHTFLALLLHRPKNKN